MWSKFLIAVAVAVVSLMIMNRRETVNQTRYTVACETKSDSARAFFDGFTKGVVK